MLFCMNVHFKLSLLVLAYVVAVKPDIAIRIEHAAFFLNVFEVYDTYIFLFLLKGFMINAMTLISIK